MLNRSDIYKELVKHIYMMSISGGAWHPSSRGAHGMRTRHCRVLQRQQSPPWSCGCVPPLDPSSTDASRAGQHN